MSNLIHRERSEERKHSAEKDAKFINDMNSEEKSREWKSSDEFLERLQQDDQHVTKDGTLGDSPVQRAAYRRVLVSTHLNIFLYSTCYWIQNGTLPYLTKKLGADPVVFGYLQTSFALVQLAGGPVFGRFGDIFGGRAALSLAFGSAALSYGLLAVSNSILLLFVSRLPSLFMHAMQGGQMVVTDICDSNKRADALGKLGMSYGVGMVIGPFVGGLITKNFGEHFAAFVAAVGSLVSMMVVLRFTPGNTKRIASGGSHSHMQQSEAGSGSGSGSMFSMQTWVSLLSAPGAMFMLLTRFFAGIPIGVFQSMFQVVAMETFKLAPDQNGYLMSFIGVTTMLMQGIGVGLLTKVFSESMALLFSSFLLVWVYILLANVGNILQLCLVCLPLVVGLTTQNVVITSALTHTVSPENTGAILGLNMAVNSLIRTFAPTIGGYILGRYGFPSFGYFGCVVSAFLTVIHFVRNRLMT